MHILKNEGVEILALYMVKKVTFNLQTVVGAIIVLHGLARIIFIDKYIDFVLYNFSEMLTTDTTLVIGAALFPFIEFFIGGLIIFNVGIKKSIRTAILVSVIMGLFIIVGSLYSRLIYHTIVVVSLIFLYIRERRNDSFNCRAF